jgi:hypothetical protein
MDTAPGIDAHNKTSQPDHRPQNKTRKTWPLEVSVARHQQQKQPRTFTHPIVEEQVTMVAVKWSGTGRNTTQKRITYKDATCK